MYLLGAGPVAAIETDRGQPVVAGEEQLRLACLFRQRERLAIRVVRLLKIALALVDLRHDDQGTAR